ncbi:hypothetical protein B566_EDAN011379 [Ephemera danica]|nr:hypothetical protein B566_EDAN011379 [Ephemera danica]
MSLFGLNVILRQTGRPATLTLVRHRWGKRISGKSPREAKSLKQRLEEANKSDPSIDFKVDIGLPQVKYSRKKVLSERLAYLKEHRSNPSLEKQARTGQLSLDLTQVKEDWWQTSCPHHLQNIAEHYGVFQHLFGDAYFTPQVKLEIAYPQAEDKFAPVYCGNLLKPSEVKSAPDVHFESEADTFWTLALTNPDGHLTQNDAEYVHWFVLNLSERTFSTLEFYRQRQDVLTPAGLAFFQADWDASLTDFFHNTLKMKEPVYEYDFPPPYIRPQEWFPIRKPFNLYLDKYRDPKAISKEFLLRKLAKEHPFKPPTPPLRFPNAVPIPKTVPSWLALEKKKARNKWGRINDM